MDRTARLLAAIDADPTLLERLLLIAEPSPPDRILGPEEAVAVVSPFLAGHTREHLVGLALDRRHRVLAADVLSIGNDAYTIVCPRTLFRWALAHRAQSILLAHNHPSGDPEPSPQDFEVTRQVAEAGRLLRIPLVDHLVIAGTRWTSLAERGALPSWSSPPPMAF